MAFTRKARTAQRKIREANQGAVAKGWQEEAKRAGFEAPEEAFPGGETEWVEWNNS